MGDARAGVASATDNTAALAKRARADEEKVQRIFRKLTMVWELAKESERSGSFIEYLDDSADKAIKLFFAELNGGKKTDVVDKVAMTAAATATLAPQDLAVEQVREMKLAKRSRPSRSTQTQRTARKEQKLSHSHTRK